MRNIPLLNTLLNVLTNSVFLYFLRLTKLSAEHSNIMKGKIVCWPMFLFSGYLMLVKQGAEYSALEYFVKCFD